MTDRFKKQLDFFLEIDKVKNILRMTSIADGSRRENDAEHSWSLAIMAFLFVEYVDENVDLLKVIKMVLIHDLVEIYAGDTFCFDEEGMQDKEAREQASADKIFGLLETDEFDNVNYSDKGLDFAGKILDTIQHNINIFTEDKDYAITLIKNK